MTRSPEVVIVGGGPAGAAAALRLARAGVAVLVLEGADYAGAENWSGCVYHADALLRPDVLGPAAWADAPVERRVVRRRLVFTDGRAGLGFDASATSGNDFGAAWTVLRPRLDRWLMTRAIDAGALVLPGTTATGLLYDGERVVGVRTERGPVRAPLVFLAEGDAAGLCRREGLERVPAPAYAQGVKAVLALSEVEINARFGLKAGDGVAEEWVLRAPLVQGRASPLHLTVFLYTNRDTLSLGFVVPLERLAEYGPVDHSELLARLMALPIFAARLKGAVLVAYGAKVIRSGGLNQAPGARPGLILGGALAGLGQELPYPNFIGPALTSGVLLGDALERARARGGDIAQEYARLLAATPEAANARLTATWPQALEHSSLVWQRLPEFAGRWVGGSAATRRRALAALLAPPWGGRSFKPLLQVLRAVPGTAPALATRWFTTCDGDEQALAVPTAASELVGALYGRREPLLARRLAAARRNTRVLPLLQSITRAAGSALLGAGGWLADAISWRWHQDPLTQWLERHPLQARERRLAQPLELPATRQALAWLGPMQRSTPDRRHLHLPPALSNPVAAATLARVCPVEVYRAPPGRLGAQFENCIKCESCRVAVPGIDWNRSGRHRLQYRLPQPWRSGPDGSVEAPERLSLPVEPASDPATAAAIAALHRALCARPAYVSGLDVRQWQQALAALGLPDAQHARLQGWLEAGHYGWLEQELAPAPGTPSIPAAAPSPGLHRAWIARVQQDAAGLLADRLAWMTFLAAHRRRAEAAAQALGASAPALAWCAVLHWLAEQHAGAMLTEPAALVTAGLDGAAGWIPERVALLVDPAGRRYRAHEAIVRAHADALDGAYPVRRTLPGLPPFPVTPASARLVLAFARGFVGRLHERAGAYARSRIQFAGALPDRAGRDSIAKFGAVKRMLAEVAAAHAALEAAQRRVDSDPAAVLLLVGVLWGPGPTAVPWAAGQVFGGMAYSEEDELARRYRDGLLLTHWAQAETADESRAFAFARTLFTDAEPEARAFFEYLPQAAPESVAPAPLAPRARKRALWTPPVLAYRSGGFAHGARLAPGSVLVPEHFQMDPVLRHTRAQVWRLLRSGFRSPDPTRSYGHYIDDTHALVPADIARLRAFNAFATLVPVALGGLGWSKAQYAILTRLLMGEIDTAAGLLVMASTSIGTTPVLLGLSQDLPELQQALDDWNGSQEQALDRALTAVANALAPLRPQALRRALSALGHDSERLLNVRGSPLRYFARDWFGALAALIRHARSHEVEALPSALARARAARVRLGQRLHEERAALAPRDAAHERFLAALATGEISAFALTEPAAGSDTGALQTRAEPCEARLQPLPQPGFYTFEPSPGVTRILLDSGRISIRNRRLGCTLPDGGWAPLADSPRGTRRGVLLPDGLAPFDDLGRPVATAAGLVYRYFEVTGAKMWITNGSIADRFCLYAQTADGPTGFMVDARAEGLHAGPNERKLGQRASPTNELRLGRVRVEQDAILGFAGHGQANALETLSVGRGGIVTGCATLLERLLRDYQQVWARAPAAWAWAAAERQRLETLAARLVGLADAVTVGDFRIEAALSKYLASEALHRVLLTLERLLGPDAAAIEHPLEKWRRDARVLNIYEGTNEVQRFLVLKDLAALAQLPEATAGPVTDGALRAACDRFWAAVRPALAALAAPVWTEPDLQVRWFGVVDWLGELYVWTALAERAAVRAAWGLETQVLDPALALTRQRVAALESLCVASLQPGAVDWPEAVLALANATLVGAERPAPALAWTGPLSGPAVAVLRSRRLWDGARWVFDGWYEPDLAALEALFAVAPVVDLVAVAPSGAEDALRRLQAAGARVVYLEDRGCAGPFAVAAAMQRHVTALTRVVVGASAEGFAEGLAAALGARLLVAPVQLQECRRGLRARMPDERLVTVATARPLVLALKADPTGRADVFAVPDWLAALSAPLLRIPLPAAAVLTVQDSVTAARGSLPAAFADPEALAQWILAHYGRAAAGSEARLTAGTGKPEGALWLGSAAALAAPLEEGALRALMDLELPYSLLASVPAGAPWVCAAQALQAPCHGVWTWPEGASAETLAAALTGLTGPLIFGPEHRLLGARVARAAGLDLRLGVMELAATRSLRRVGDRLLAEALEPGLAFGVDGYRPRTHPGPGNPVGRWQRLEVGSPRVRADAPAPAPQIVLDLGFGLGQRAAQTLWIAPLAATLAAVTRARIEIGGTRKAVQELGLMGPEQQIGQTGQRVAPALLIACGISGAPQHLVGIDPGTAVIAINRDPDAAIFAGRPRGVAAARCVGLLEDWLPRLEAALRAPVETWGSRDGSSIGAMLGTMHHGI